MSFSNPARESAHDPVNLLWTGGWDSTFRLLELVLSEGRRVQPYYVIDTGRKTSLREIETMQRVRERLAEAAPEAAALVAPTVLFSIHDIEADPEITQRYETLRESVHLGSQYDWLARWARQLEREEGVDALEFSVERGGHAYEVLKGHTQSVPSDAGRGHWKLHEENEDERLSIFGSFRFPLLHMSKPEMEALAEQEGFLDILELSWFCFYPINGKPCGICNPCQVALDQGMAHRFPRSALFRNRFRPAVVFVYRTLKKARQKLHALLEQEAPPEAHTER